MKDIIKIATKELGITEKQGSEHNPRILYYAQTVNLSMAEGDETPWCSIFANFVASQAKFIRSEKANARSWLNIGFEVDDPEPGDVVIYWRESKESWKGHVGFFLGFSKDQSRIYTLGGNQGNAVSVSAYKTSRLLQFRRLVKNTIRLTTKTLVKGDRGREVANVQDALKMAGFNCGTSDGFFGSRTESAIIELQESSQQLDVNGQFNTETKKLLKELIANQNN